MEHPSEYRYGPDLLDRWLEFLDDESLFAHLENRIPFGRIQQRTSQQNARWEPHISLLRRRDCLRLPPSGRDSMAHGIDGRADGYPDLLGPLVPLSRWWAYFCLLSLFTHV